MAALIDVFLTSNKVPIVKIIVSRANIHHVDPVLAVTVALWESRFNPFAVGDHGTSFGLFQLHKGGELGQLPPDDAFDIVTNCDIALSAMASVAMQLKNVNSSPGAIAAAAQRPGNRFLYASAINLLYPAVKAKLQSLRLV